MTKELKKYISRKRFLSFAVKQLKTQVDLESDESRLWFAILESAIADAKYRKYKISILKGYVFNNIAYLARAWINPADRNFQKTCNILGLDENWVAETIWNELQLYDKWEYERSHDTHKRLLKAVDQQGRKWCDHNGLSLFRTYLEG